MKTLLATLALFSSLAFAGDARPTAGPQTVEVSAYGPAVFDVDLDPLPPGTQSVTLRLRLSMSERMMVSHLPYPNGLGSIVWGTGGPAGPPQPLEATVSIPDTDTMELTAECRSNVGTSWPLASGGMLAVIPTEGEVFEYATPAWDGEVTAKIRLPAAWTALQVEPMNASVSFAALQTLTIEVIPD